MLSTKEITKMYKGSKITSRADLYKAKKTGQKAVNLQGSSVAKLHRLQKSATCEIYKLRIFATLPNSTVSSSSSAFLLQMSSEMIMHLGVQLGFVVFESARRK